MPLELVGVQHDGYLGIGGFIVQRSGRHLALVGCGEDGVHDVGVLLGISGAALLDYFDLIDAGVLPRIALGHDSVARHFHDVSGNQVALVDLLAVIDDLRIVDVGGNIRRLGLLVDEEHLVAVHVGHHRGVFHGIGGQVAALVRVVVLLRAARLVVLLRGFGRLIARLGGGAGGAGALVVRAALNRAACESDQAGGQYADEGDASEVRKLHGAAFPRGVK